MKIFCLIFSFFALTNICSYSKELNVLVVNSSVRGEKSFTKMMIADFIEKTKTKHKDVKIVERDLAKKQPKHIDNDFINAAFTGYFDKTKKEKEVLKESTELINEIKAADVLVVGAPMINFSVPSNLKAWIDHVVINEETFRYNKDNNTYTGLLSPDLKVVILAASGGVYDKLLDKKPEFLVSYLKTVFMFMGATNIEVVWGQGVHSPEALKEVDRVKKQISKIVKDI